MVFVRQRNTTYLAVFGKPIFATKNKRYSLALIRIFVAVAKR